MSEKNCNVCKKTSIGGQAVIEGIMMRGPKRTVLAVRTPDRSIEVEDVPFPNIKEKCPLFKVPVIRGVVSFGETLFVGYKTLMRSADLSGMTDLEEEEEAENKEKKLRKKAEKKGVPYEELKAKADAKSSKMSDKLMGVIMVIASILGVALALFLFMYIPTKIFNLFNSLASGSLGNWRALIEGVMKLIIFIVYIVAVSQTAEIKKVFKYHGAEHKTIFCYEHGLELTVENVRKQIRFHPRCGTSFMFLMIAVGILFSTVIILFAPSLTKITALWVTIKILLVPLFCGVGFELIKFCGKHDNIVTKIIAAPGLWVQRITTKEPDDEMIEVAIEAMMQVIPENGEDEIK